MVFVVLNELNFAVMHTLHALTSAKYFDALQESARDNTMYLPF